MLSSSPSFRKFSILLRVRADFQGVVDRAQRDFDRSLRAAYGLNSSQWAEVSKHGCEGLLGAYAGAPVFVSPQTHVG